MHCRLLCAKPLSEPTPSYLHCGIWCTTLVIFESNGKQFHQRKCIQMSLAKLWLFSPSLNVSSAIRMGYLAISIFNLNNLTEADVGLTASWRLRVTRLHQHGLKVTGTIAFGEQLYRFKDVQYLIHQWQIITPLNLCLPLIWFNLCPVYSR